MAYMPSREKQNSHQHTFSEWSSVEGRASSSVYRRTFGSWTRGNFNLATFAGAAVSGQIDAKRLFHFRNANLWK